MDWLNSACRCKIEYVVEANLRLSVGVWKDEVNMDAEVLLSDKVVLHLLFQGRRHVVCEAGVAKGATDEFGVEGKIRQSVVVLHPALQLRTAEGRKNNLIHSLNAQSVAGKKVLPLFLCLLSGFVLPVTAAVGARPPMPWPLLRCSTWK